MFWERRFLAFKEAHFSQSITSKIFEPWRWSLFWKCGKFHVDLKNAIKFEKLFLVRKIIAFELVSGFSLNCEENTWDQPSTCEKTVFTFWIWFREMFSNSICLGLKRNYAKNDAVQIWAVLGTREDFDSQKVFWKRSFLAFKEVHFSQSIISKIFEPSSWSFFSKCTKFHVNFKSGIKIAKIVFGF